MVTIGMNYEVVPGKAETFEKSFHAVLEAMSDMRGHTASHLYRDVENERRYLIISNWSDEQAFKDFVRSKTFAKVTTWASAEILAGRPTHTYYEPKSPA